VLARSERIRHESTIDPSVGNGKVKLGMMRAQVERVLARTLDQCASGWNNTSVPWIRRR
jgi:hypothetical protein